MKLTEHNRDRIKKALRDARNMINDLIDPSLTAALFNDIAKSVKILDALDIEKTSDTAAGFSWDPKTEQILIIGENATIAIAPADIARLRNILLFAGDAETTKLRAENKRLLKGWRTTTKRTRGR